MKNLLLLGALICSAFTFAQGDDCTQATYLPDVTDFCSGNGAFTSVGSTASGYGTAACWNAAATSDVWFSFIAVGTDMLGSITGSGGGAGTMINPRVALYTGTCGGTLTELACNSGTGVVQFYSAALTVGQMYYIRVSTTAANVGTFKLCANNYTPPTNPGADCSGATRLCDKSTVSVASFTGPGTSSNEPNIAGSCMTVENNSVWYKWTCATSGTLTFDITPLNGLNDIDFVLFQIPDINSCTKTVVRCNTSSCTPGTGSTGLNTTDGDVSENPGCEFGENAYCSQITMTAGTSYALVVDNANAFDGFNLAFGGTGTFLGAQPVISPVITPICVGESLVFDGSSSTNVSGGLTWTFSDGSVITNQSGPGPFNINYPAAGNYVAVLEGVDALGCHSTQNVNVTVGAPPPVSAGIDQSVCTGQSVTLSGSGATSYTWDNSVMNGVSFVPSTTQTYTVTGTDANGCENTDQVMVTVTPGAVVNGGADQAVCAGQSVTLSGSGVASYSWNNGVTNGAAFTPATTQTYTVTGTSSGGCVSTDQVLVTVNPLPAVNAGTDQSVCTGGTVTLSGSGATSYTWNNGVTNGTAFTPASTQTYTVTGTGVGGCQNTDQVVVTVNLLPNVNAGTDQAVCAGQSVTLNGSGATSYSWNNSVTNGVSFVPASTQTYTVTGTNGNGCQNTDQVLVTVNPLPVVNAGADQAVCVGGNVTLSGSGATSYAWNNSVINGTAFTPASTQTYTVTGTGAGGCQNTDQVIVTVNPLPNVSAGSSQTVCAGDAVTLSGSGAASYSWNNGVQNGVSFTANGTQSYILTGTDGNGCMNTSTVTVTALPVPQPVILTSGPLAGLPGLTVGFSNGSSNAVSYSWIFGNGQTDQTNDISESYQVTYNDIGTYQVTLTADNGICEATTQQLVTVTLPPVIIVDIPNVFTPNGDGENDVFNINAQNASSIKISVFNRWGNPISEFEGMTTSWDGSNGGGEDVTEGVYFFLYDVLGIDGNHTAGQAYVQLIR